MRVVGENAEISGGGIAVPSGDRVVGLVAEPPWMIVVKQVVVRKSGVATVYFGHCPGGFAIIAEEPLTPAKDAARGQHRRMAGIAVERQAIAVQFTGGGTGLRGRAAERQAGDEAVDHAERAGIIVAELGDM